MATDALGAIQFVAIDTHPHLPQRQFSTRSIAGIPGQSIWDDGRRGVPFRCRVRAYAATFAAARQVYRNTRALQDGNPIAVSIAGVAEPGQLYQVMSVEPVPGRIKSVVFGRGPTTTYYAWCELDVTLLPI